jgi:probable HAF family extracellular repeat protein
MTGLHCRLLMSGVIVLLVAACDQAPTAPATSRQSPDQARAQAVEYTAHPLGNLGGSFSSAADINRFGYVVGRADIATGEVHAFIALAPGGPMQDLGLPIGYTSARATAINDSNVVVGTASGPGGDRAFSWTSSGGFVILPTLGGGSAAEDINNRGTIVGTSGTTTGESHPFAFFPATGIQDLGDMGGGNTWALAVNDFDVVVGAGWVDEFGTIEPYRWTSGSGMVGIASPFGIEAAGINNGSGGDEVIVGWDFASEASAFKLASGWRLLDKLDPQGFAIARDVNIKKVIVGQSDDASGNTHAFVLHRVGGKAEDLTPGHPFFSLAFSINDCGLIAGYIEQLAGQEATVWIPFRTTCAPVP